MTLMSEQVDRTAYRWLGDDVTSLMLLMITMRTMTILVGWWRLVERNQGGAGNWGQTNLAQAHWHLLSSLQNQSHSFSLSNPLSWSTMSAATRAMMMKWKVQIWAIVAVSRFVWGRDDEDGKSSLLEHEETGEYLSQRSIRPEYRKDCRWRSALVPLTNQIQRIVLVIVKIVIFKISGVFFSCFTDCHVDTVVGGIYLRCASMYSMNWNDAGIFRPPFTDYLSELGKEGFSFGDVELPEGANLGVGIQDDDLDGPQAVVAETDNYLIDQSEASCEQVNPINCCLGSFSSFLKICRIMVGWWKLLVCSHAPSWSWFPLAPPFLSDNFLQYFLSSAAQITNNKLTFNKESSSPCMAIIIAPPW